ncbi:MAG: DUF5696 domain-containing protein [bacterium]
MIKSKKLLKTVSFLLLTAFILIDMVPIEAEEIELGSEFELVTENPHLQLFINRETTEIAVRDKKDKNVWRSNPDLEESGKDRAKSQFSINYYTAGDRPRSMNNYDDSIILQQYNIDEIDKGVRVEYLVGELWDEDANLPEFISEERMEDLIFDKLGEDDIEFIKEQYHLISLKEIEDKSEHEQPSIYNVDEKEVFQDYTISLNGNIPDKDTRGDLKTLLLDRIATRLDVTRGDVTHSQLSPFKDTSTYILKDGLFEWDIEDMIVMLDEIGYSPEDAIEDFLEYNLDPPRSNEERFTIPVEYYLEDDNFIAKIPAEEIEYPENVLDEDGMRVSYPLTEIDFLEFMGAGGPQDEGYIFIPDGSGALIDFNNDKTFASSFSQRIYGRDWSEDKRNEKLRNQEQIHLPVYGIAHDDRALLAIIEEGESLTSIKADISRSGNPYNKVYPRFLYLPYAQSNFQWWGINVYQKRPYQQDFKIRFAFLEEEKSDYVGMAEYYREYLQKKGKLEKLAKTEEIPFVLELTGAINRIESVLGVPREVERSLTTFKEAESIIEELKDSDLNENSSESEKKNVENIHLRYSGIFKGGVKQYYPDPLQLESSVGLKEDFLELINNNDDIMIYPDLSFQEVHRSNSQDNYNIRDDSSMSLDRVLSKLFEYNLATHQIKDGSQSYVLSPNKLSELTKNITGQSSQYNMNGISLRNIGVQLNSDFRRNENFVERTLAQDIVVQQLQKLQEEGNSIMARGVNSYILPYTDIIIESPLRSSGYKITDRSVPFYQIVVSGFKNYTGPPLNLSEDYQEMKLKSIEYGSLPYYQWIFEESSKVKGTNFDYLYSVHYKDWLDEAREFYNRANKVLAPVYHQKIIDHTRLDNKLYKTTYEHGQEIIVNYNEHPVEVDGIEIKGRDFKLLEEGVNNENMEQN